MTNTTIAQLNYMFYRHGWFAVVGLIMMGSTLALQFIGISGAHVRVDEIHAEQVAQRRQDVARVEPKNQTAERQDIFISGLPPSADAIVAIKTIHQLAKERNVQLFAGEYRVTTSGTGRLQTYQINLPATSSYPEIRAWLAEVMNTLPALALDDVSFHRDEVGSGKIEARTRLTLFMKGP